MNRKERDMNVLKECAILYKLNLMNKNLLVVSSYNKQISVASIEFNKNNYKHLTGVVTPLSANKFMDALLGDRLSFDDWDYKKDGTSQLKIRALPQMVEFYKSARMIGTYSGNRIYLKSDICFGGVYCYLGLIVDKNNKNLTEDIYVPNSLINGNIKGDTSNQERILAIFRKNKKDTKYKEMTYLAKDVELHQLKKYIKEYVFLGPLPHG